MADSPRSLVRVVVPVYRELTPDEESSLRNNVRVLAAWPFTVLRPAQRHCGLQPHDAQRGVLCVVSRYGIYPDLPYRRLDFPRRAGRLVPAGLRLRGGAVASAAALRSAAGQTVYAVEGADETSPGRGFAAGALRPRRQRRACATYRTEAESYLADPCHLRNEDVFWAVVPREFRYPAPDEALRFSIDTHPAYALRRLGGDLPFGCHSWTKRRMRRAWRGIIPAAK